MSTTTITTVTKMLESLPEAAQDRAVEHLRAYIESLRDDLKWDQAFQKTSSKLMEVARRTRQEIAERKAQPMDFEQYWIGSHDDYENDCCCTKFGDNDCGCAA